MNQLAIIAKRNYYLAAVAVLLSCITLNLKIIGGVALGAALCCANFSYLAHASKNESDNVGWFFIKMMALITAALLSLLLLPISALGFGAGFMIFLISTLASTASEAGSSAPADAAKASNTHG